MVQAFRRDASVYESARLRLQGLDPQAAYEVTDLDKPDAPAQVFGRDLMESGLRVELPARPSAALIVYRRI